MTEFVRVRIGDRETNVSRAWATARELTVLDEPVTTASGNPRPDTRRKGRPVKRKTTIAAEAERKSAPASGNETTDATEENS